ncbi:hypothetical protein ABW21_db0204138 [Orbilia brochopaga]|nr:hypothetical protein ABW21_db0204138 [Drechslerella brochopaga]
MTKGRRGGGKKKGGGAEKKALNKLLAEADAAAAAAIAKSKQAAAERRAEARVAADASTAAEAPGPPETSVPAIVSDADPEHTIDYLDGPILNARLGCFMLNLERWAPIGPEPSHRAAAAIAAASGKYAILKLNFLTMVERKEYAEMLVVELILRLNRHSLRVMRITLTNLKTISGNIHSVTKGKGKAKKGVPMFSIHGIGKPPHSNVPVYFERSENVEGDEYLFRPNGIPMGGINKDFPGIGPDAWPKPVEILSESQMALMEEDWVTSWPFLVHTIFNEVYMMGHQILLWGSSNGKLCWCTMQDLDLMKSPALATIKNVWPKAHAYHEPDTDGEPCKECIKEMEDRDIMDFPPILGFPSVAKPPGYLVDLNLKDKAKSVQTKTEKKDEPKTAEMDWERGTIIPPRGDGNRKNKKGKGKVSQIASGSSSHPAVAILQPTGPGMPYNLDTKNMQAKVVGANFVGGKGYIDVDFMTPFIEEAGPSIAAFSKSLFSPIAAPPPQLARPVELRSSPTPRVLSNRAPYEHLRSQRLELALGIGRFVIDAIKDGKRPYFDVSLDGRIEMGHMGDSFAIEHGRKQYGKKFVNDLLHKPSTDGAEMVMCTAPIIRIRDQEFASMDGVQREIEFPPAVAYQSLFKDVKMSSDDEYDTSTSKGKGKKPAKPYDPHVSFGSLDYEIKPGRPDAYAEVETFAQDMVRSLDISAEVQECLAETTRDLNSLDMFKQVPPAPHASSSKNPTKPKENTEAPIKKSDPKPTPTPPAAATQTSTSGAALTLNEQEQLLKAIKALPSSCPPLNLDFDKNYRVMDNCLKGIINNNNKARDICRDVIRDHKAFMAKLPPPVSEWLAEFDKKYPQYKKANGL